MGWTPRPLLLETLEKIDKRIEETEPFIIVAQLPTGYGKSTLTMTLLQAVLNGYPYFSRVIHVLPMRSIVDDLAHSLKILFGEDYVGAQHMGLNDTPFLVKKAVITTLDTFILNFSKIPASELVKAFKYGISHHDFARGMIYSSITVFDEFHLFSGLGTRRKKSMEEEMKSLQAAVSAMISLALGGVPVIVATATLPPPMLQFLKEEANKIGVDVDEVTFSPEKDPNFAQDRDSKKLTLTISDEDVKRIIQLKLRQGKTVLVVTNTVDEAVEIYRDALTFFDEKNRDDIMLVHGRLSEKIKKDRIKRLVEKKPRLLIATQVVEAGVNMSYDVLISAPCPADRLIQRSGRIARFKNEKSGEIIIATTLSTGPYIEEIVEKSTKIMSDLYAGRQFSKLELETSTKEILKQVYKETLLSTRKNLLNVIRMLDDTVFLEPRDAVHALKTFCGFTDSFGLITVYPYDKETSTVDRENIVGVSEALARRILRTKKLLVKHGEVVKDSREAYKLQREKCLAIHLLIRGYQGIAHDYFDPDYGIIIGEEE